MSIWTILLYLLGYLLIVGLLALIAWGLASLTRKMLERRYKPENDRGRKYSEGIGIFEGKLGESTRSPKPFNAGLLQSTTPSVDQPDSELAKPIEGGVAKAERRVKKSLRTRAQRLKRSSKRG